MLGNVIPSAIFDFLNEVYVSYSLVKCRTYYYEKSALLLTHFYKHIFMHLYPRKSQSSYQLDPSKLKKILFDAHVGFALLII